MKAILETPMLDPLQELGRRAFLFSTFTGLAFTDVQHLKHEHITVDSNGEYWIRKAREKTDNMCDIPLLDIPRMIIEKYKPHPTCIKKGVVLPVPSNQRMNSYLKEIADACHINKPLSTHVIENKKLTKVVSLTGNDLETSGLLYSAMFCTNQKNAFLICKSSVFIPYYQSYSPEK